MPLFPLFPHLFAMKWWDQMPWSLFSECWANFKPTFSLSSFTFIKRLFGSSSLSAVSVVSSAYLRLLIFLLAILIPACATPNPAFLMMYSAYKLNKQGDNIQPWSTPFPLEPVCCFMSNSNCCFLICIQIFKRQVRWSGYSHLFKNFPHFVVIHIVNKAEVDIFPELSCFFDYPADAGNLTCGSSAFSKSSLNIWSSRFMYRWSVTWRILSIILLVCEISAIVQ